MTYLSVGFFYERERHCSVLLRDIDVYLLPLLPANLKPLYPPASCQTLVARQALIQYCQLRQLLALAVMQFPDSYSRGTSPPTLPWPSISACLKLASDA